MTGVPEWPIPPSGGSRRKLAWWEKVVVVVILTWSAIFLACDTEFHIAPWEIAYRHQAILLLRAELEALPPMTTNQAMNITIYGPDRTLVVENFTRQDARCADVLAHYRQVAPANGWIYQGRYEVETESIDSYSGVFNAYHATLDVDCDSTYSSYSLHADTPFPYDFALFGWLSGARWDW